MDIFKVWNLPEPYFSLSSGNPTNVVEHLRGHDGAGGGDERTGDGDGGAGADDGDNGTGESDDDSHDGDSKGILVNASSFKFKTFE